MLGASQWVIYRIRCGASEALPTTLRVRHDAVVADLAVALGFEPHAALSVDGQRVRPEDELREIGLCQGSVVTSVRSGPDRPVGPGLDWTSFRPESGQLVLIVRGGLDAGRRLVLGPADALVGRAPACDLVLDDPAVALLHGVVRHSGPDAASFELLADADADLDTQAYADAAAGIETGAVTVSGAVQVHRLEVGQQLQVGRYRLELAREDLRQRPAGLDPRLHRTTRGTLVINRPPRPGRSPSGSPLSVPQPPGQAGATPLAVVAIVLPLVLSMVMVAVTGSWLFALLTILSPLLAISNWWTGRRSARRRGRATTRAFAAEVASFERALTLAHQQADAAAEQRAVDLAEVARRAMLPARSLWERRLGQADVLHVVLGRAQRAASLPLVWPGGQLPSFGSEQGGYSAGTRPGLHPAVEEVVVRANRSANRPVELDLAEDGVVGIVGDPAAARAVARSLVLQLVVHHGPADLATVFVAGERHCHWQWMEWLPHRLELDPDQDTDGASCGLTDRGTTGTRAVSAVKSEYAEEFSFIEHLLMNSTPFMSVAFPRSLYRDIGMRFDESLTTTEDWDFLMRAASLVGVADSKEVTAIYRGWVTQDSSRTEHDMNEWLLNQYSVDRKFDSEPLLLPRGEARAIRELVRASHAHHHEVVEAVTLLGLAVVDHRVREGGLVSGVLEHHAVHDDAGVQALHVVALVNVAAPPRGLDVVLQLDAQRAVIVKAL